MHARNHIKMASCLDDD